MHHKYVVRDGESVWTGSTNWTTDSWTLQENLVMVARLTRSSRPPSRANFEELWKTRDVSRTGRADEPRALEVGGHQVRPWFTPGHGEDLSHRIAAAIGRARRRVRIASPVITAGPVIGTLAEVAAEARVDLRGVVDATQMAQVFQQWREQPALGLEGPDPRVDPRARRLQREALHAATRRRASTTSCTRRSRWPTTWCSPARSTSRARAS